MSDTTTFELSLSGGVAEKLYRRARPDVMKLRWKTPLGVRVSKEERDAARQQWTIAALQEYKSACAQATVLASLVAARVPLDLSAMAARFPVDELVHAEVCARTANALGGGAPVVFDPAQVFAGSAPTTKLLDVSGLVAQLFGVGEGWSLGFLEMLHHETRVPLLKSVWRVLVKDEAVHAKFAFTFLEWAREELDDDAASWEIVRAKAKESVAAMRAGWKTLASLPKEAFSPISPLGTGDHAAYLARANRALEKRVLAPFERVGIDLR